MLTAIDFNTLIFGFFIGMIVFFKIFITLIPVTAAAFYLFKFLSPKKSAFPLIFMVAFSCLLGSIFFDKSISPKSMIKHFSKGNYSATIIFREEGCKILRERPFLKVTPQGTIENAKVFLVTVNLFT
ncbi:MAG: hypothetical protein AB2990_00250 [Candidatus Symbiodolus clandestinus]